MNQNEKRACFVKYASAIAYVEIETPDGSRGTGSCFHIGDNVFITARHVVDGNKILGITTTERATERDPAVPGAHRVVHSGGRATKWSEPYLHPDPKLDVAALIIEGMDCATLQLGGHLDDWIGSEFVLSSVVIMGYPRVPHANSPILVAASGEVNAVVDLYSCPNARFVVSQMARGGFSGGPAISEYGFVLGVVTDSLVEDDKSAELGFCSVIAVEPILDCLSHHKIMPKALREFWSEHGLFGETDQDGTATC